MLVFIGIQKFAVFRPAKSHAAEHTGKCDITVTETLADDILCMDDPFIKAECRTKICLNRLFNNTACRMGIIKIIKLFCKCFVFLVVCEVGKLV